MSNIVESFKIDVPATELKAHFEARLAAHRTALETLQGNRIQLIGVTGDTSEVVKKHRMQEKLLSYLVSHIPPNVTYRLSLHELDGLYVLQDLTE